MESNVKEFFKMEWKAVHPGERVIYGDFMIPGIAFLYIAGCIGWAGRNYLMAIRNDKDATTKEIQIDVALALKSTLEAATWPLAALKQLKSGELLEDDSKVTVSPR